MRKILSCFLVFFLFVGLVGCSFGEDGARDQVYSEEYLQSFVASDSVETILLGGPLYVGATYFADEELQSFQREKKVVIDRLRETRKKSWEEMEELSTKLRVVRTYAIQLLAQGAESHKELGRYLKEGMLQPLENHLSFVGIKALYDAVPQEVNPHSAVAAAFDYQGIVLTQEAGLVLTEDFSQLLSSVLSYEAYFNASSHEDMQRLGGAVSKDLQGVIDEAGQSLQRIQQLQARIHYDLKLLESAEYYMGKASLQRMEEIMKGTEGQIQTLVIKEGVSKEDREFLVEMQRYYGDMTKALGSTFDTVDSGQMLPLLGTSEVFPPRAKAKDDNFGSGALDLLKNTAQKGYEAGKSVGALTWEGAKSAFQGAKTATGVGVDTLGAVTKSGFDVIFGAANGNSTKEITDEMKKNFQSVRDNYEKGASGSSTMKTASGYFEAVEKGAGDAASGAVEKTLGKGWTSWALGHVGQLTANMVVSFGKGITKIADTKATTGEIIEGGLDVGLSFIGGSKVLVSSSQVLSGSKEALKLFGKKGVNFLGNILHSGDVKKLKGISSAILEKTKLTPKDVETLLSNSLSIEIKEGIQAELKQVSKNLNEEFIKLLKGAGSTLVENGTVGAKKAYTEFVNEAFEHSLKGYKDALLGVLGKDFTSFVDNLVATKADDMIKEIVKEYVDKGVIPGIEIAPPLKDIVGTWKEMHMTVQEVILSPEFRATAEKEGCNLEEIEAQKGQRKKVAFSLQAENEKGGTLTIQAPGEEAQKFPFTYEEGELRVLGGESEFSVSMQGKITEENGEYKMKGGMDINYKRGAMIIKSQVEGSTPLSS